MDQIVGIITQQTCSEQPAGFSVRPEFAESLIITRQVELSDIAALRRRANHVMTFLFGVGRCAAGKGKLGI